MPPRHAPDWQVSSIVQLSLSLQGLPSNAFSRTHLPSLGLQTLSVHGVVVGQTSGVPGVHVYGGVLISHVSDPLHALPSSQSSAERHAQMSVPLWHIPVMQESPSVHGSPSLQANCAAIFRHILPVHTSRVHSLLSSQSASCVHSAPRFESESPVWTSEPSHAVPAASVTITETRPRGRIEISNSTTTR